MSRAAGPARLDVPLDRPGKFVGALRIPFSSDRSAYGEVVVPVAVVANGEGPTALLSAGLHGDEYEGQIALGRLVRDLAPEAIRGRVIVLPCANPPAALAGRRTSPLDGGNLARLFVDDPGAGPTAHIAEGIARLLLAHADVVLDLHSGGGSLEYLPCSFGRLPADTALVPRVVELLEAFGAPHAAVVRRPDARGTLVAAALERGIPAIATELGGGGGVTRDTVALAVAGVRRVLAWMGIDARKDSGGRSAASRLLAVEPSGFVRSPGHGMFEPAVMLGDEVTAGDLAGRLSDPQRPDRPPENLFFAAGGIVICRRVPAMAQAGDVLFHLGEDVDRAALLSR
ncbi:M14 family metallopeptidase [Alsobacter sp. R-9]